MNNRGFTLIEAMVSLSVLAVLMGSVASGLVSDSRAHEAFVAHMGPEMKLRRILNRMATEVRMAGVWAEDRDHDGVLDDGEDLNGNGILDSDWNLPDGARHNELAFNAREDVRDETGKVIATGHYTPKSRFFLEDGTLCRERTRMVDGNPVTARASLANGLKALEFERVGGLVVIRATVTVNLSGGRTQDHTLETRVWLRN